MAKLSYEELKSVVATFVDEQKIAVDTFTATRDNTVGLLDKIGKIFTIDTSYIDKLSMFEGEELSFGKTIEEWQEDLKLPESFNSSGSSTLAPHEGTYRPVAYSYTLGKTTFPITIRNNDIERAVHFVEQFVSIIAMKSKRLYDSVAVWRYQVKRQMLAVLAGMCEDASGLGSSYSGETMVFNKAYAVNSLVRSASSGQNIKYGIVVKPVKSGDYANWAGAVADGAVIVYDGLVEELAIPVDTSTGEAFIKSIKKSVEIASDLSEGHSLNGNTLGSAEAGLVLLLKQGVMPEVEVDVIAGAFHESKVAIPAEVKVIKDFGDNASGVYAMLIDARGLRLHNTYRAVRDQQNAQGDFLNMFYHTEDTAFISRNTFVKVYRVPSAS